MERGSATTVGPPKPSTHSLPLGHCSVSAPPRAQAARRLSSSQKLRCGCVERKKFFQRRWNGLMQVIKRRSRLIIPPPRPYGGPLEAASAAITWLAASHLLLLLHHP